MKKPFATLLLAVVLPPLARAQDLPEGVDETFAVTPQTLLTAMDYTAVVRLEQEEWEIEDTDEATLRYRRAVTIFGPDSRDAGVFPVFYDAEFAPLKDFDARVYDASGEEVGRQRERDMEDYSAIDGGSLYSHHRVRVARLYHESYPYTVVFTYEKEYDGLVGQPGRWYPQENRVPVERAVFRAEAPADLGLRFRTERADGEPFTAPEWRTDGDTHVLSWDLRNLPARDPEPMGPSWGQQLPTLHVTVDRFEMEGVPGSLASWADLGDWYAGLSEGRATLPPAAQEEVRALVADATSDREKVRRLYRYMQSQTRYVALNLGLGGWRPFSASYVRENRYGDCKGLTTYMEALLGAVDIESFPALVRAGKNALPLDPDFPAQAFNHVVLMVPMHAEGEAPADTLWLENTSQVQPFGHVGTFIEDRWVLVVKSDGASELVRTPRSGAEANRQDRRGEIALRLDGTAEVRVTTTYTGNQQEHLRRLEHSTARERDEWLHNTLSVPTFDVVNADFSEVASDDPRIALPLELRLPRYAQAMGSRLFVRPNVFERYSLVPEGQEGARQQPVVLTYAFADTDTLRFALPDGYVPEALPEPVSLEEPFGRYHAALTLADDGTLRYVRHLTLPDRRIAPEHFDAFVAFARAVAHADRQQAVFVRE